MIRVKYIFILIILLTTALTGAFVQEGYFNETENPPVINNPVLFHSTALRFLDEAKNALINQNWDLAYMLSERSLVYDSSIADAYYIQAISLLEKEGTVATVITLLEKSLDDSVQWYAYTRDSGRLLLSKQYVKVTKALEALLLLDEYPILNTSDALLIRANAYYIMQETDNARKTVYEGANQYPLDKRFDELFYSFEYHIDESDFESELDEKNTLVPFNRNYYTSFFNSRIQQFSKENSLIMLYSAIFTQDLEEKKRLLKAWNMQGSQHPLYALHALESDIIDEQAAFNYMLPFFTTIDYATLEDFINVLDDEAVIEQARTYFKDYAGTIFIDINGDLISELNVHYDKGRPSSVHYDENQDGLSTWDMTNDYGEPLAVSLHEEDMELKYDVWPYLGSVVDNSHEMRDYMYYLVDNTLAYPIVDFIESDAFQNNLSISFYTPSVRDDEVFSTAVLFDASYLIDFKTTEYSDSRARYTVLDGVIKSATYTENEYPFGYASFQGGYPVSRKVDKDRDGYFEVTELFKHDSSDTHLSEKLLHELFGFDFIAKGVSIQKVILDVNNDGLDDFTEEYITQEEVLSSWDTNSDGAWDVQYKQSDNKMNTEVHYVHPITNEIRSVYIEDNIPIIANGKNITKDTAYEFYWIGFNMGSAHAEKIMVELSLQETSIAVSVTDLLWDSENEQFVRIVGIKNGDMYFGEVFYE